MAASTVAVPLATIPAREWYNAGSDSETSRSGVCADQCFEKSGFERGRNRKQEFVSRPELFGGLQNSRQIHAHFFHPAAGHDCNPGLGHVQLVLHCVVRALDRGTRQIRQRMADKRRVDSTVAVKLLFEGEDHQRLVDVFAQQPHPSLPPCPELRADVIHHRNAALAHRASNAPVEGRGVDDDSEIRAALVRLGDQLVEQAPDFRQMAENFGDAHYR